jgi:antitoxin FitA
MTVLTIRDVPDEVRDTLAREAKARGQSMQSYLLGVLKRQADFCFNQTVLVEIEGELRHGGGLRPDSPSASEVLAEERAERERRLGNR